MNSEKDWTREQEIEKQKDKSVAQNVGLILSGNVVKEKKKSAVICFSYQELQTAILLNVMKYL